MVMLEAPQAEGEMSEKKCPVGEGECVELEYCSKCFSLKLYYFEQCPWPSRQVPKRLSERARALADARAAVESIPWPTENFTENQINFCGGVIIAAISALEVKP